jgi:hypothetical protein
LIKRKFFDIMKKMNPNQLTEEQLCAIIGRTKDDVQVFVRNGMITNEDGTFNLTACIAWKIQYDREQKS